MQELADISLFNAIGAGSGWRQKISGWNIGPDKLARTSQPLFTAIGDMVNAADEFYNWYKMARRFLNAYYNERWQAEQAPRDWSGLQMRSEAYTRTHSFKKLYDKLKVYSVFAKPPINNPISEWSKTSPLMGMIQKIKGQK